MKINRMLLFLVKYFIPRIYNLKSETRLTWSQLVLHTRLSTDLGCRHTDLQDYTRKQRVSEHPVSW